MPKPRRPLSILCFGDSLTAGYTSHGANYNPYCNIVEEKLAAAFPDADVTVMEHGMPGDVVAFEAFSARLQTELTRPTFDWVIILGGTNDLAYGVSPDDTLAALGACWDAALAKGSKVLGLTVPETHSKPDGKVAGLRKEINDGIMSHDRDGFYAFDLHAAVPYHALSPQDRRRYWDDGVHLTADGYDWMGGYIADALIKLLIQEVGATDRRSRRMLRYAQDELLFEEEMGDPKQINEGYVIVRLKDLN